jgi:hypothetical protein
MVLQVDPRSITAFCWFGSWLSSWAESTSLFVFRFGPLIVAAEAPLAFDGKSKITVSTNPKLDRAGSMSLNVTIRQLMSSTSTNPQHLNLQRTYSPFLFVILLLPLHMLLSLGR